MEYIYVLSAFVRQTKPMTRSALGNLKLVRAVCLQYSLEAFSACSNVVRCNVQALRVNRFISKAHMQQCHGETRGESTLTGATTLRWATRFGYVQTPSIDVVHMFLEHVSTISMFFVLQ